MRYWIGIDNGVSGSIAIVTDEQPIVFYYPTPVRKVLNYTKTKQWLNRVDVDKLESILMPFRAGVEAVALERPMLNPGRFKASVSALRALEATLIILERMGFPVQYIDSREWQREMLPSGLEKEELKVASLDIGRRLFPQLATQLKKDADSLLIAEYMKRKSLNMLKSRKQPF